MNWHPTRGNDPDERAAIDAKAAEWISVCEAGASPQQEAEFAAWLQADARHRKAHAELEAASRRLDPLQFLRPADNSTPNPDLPLRPRAFGNRRRRFATVVLPLAAAAVVALVFFRLSTIPPAEFHDVAVTEIGGFRQLTLPDQTVIDLNTDSELKVTFSASERRVTLARGEAHFAVAKDSTRPFVVDVGQVNVRAVGTAFNVRLLDAKVEVLVTEGKVGVQKSAEGKSASPERPRTTDDLVVAGQKAVVPAISDRNELSSAKVVVSQVTTAEILQRLAWQDKRLDFGPTALKEIVAEFNRYSQHRLVIADQKVAELNVGGSFRAGDVEALVRLLEANFDVDAEVRGNETLLRQRR